MQREWTENIAKGLSGMLFGRGHEIEPMLLESGVVPFGYGVKQGTEEDTALLPSGGETVVNFRGVARRAANIPRVYRSDQNPTYDATYEDVMDIVRLRMILVEPTSLVARGDSVFWQIVTSGSNYAGSFRNTSDGGSAIDISSVANWFRGNDTIGGLAVLSLHVRL